MRPGEWKRTRGKGPRHLTWDCGGGNRESACGMVRHADQWREPNGAKMCVRCAEVVKRTA